MNYSKTILPNNLRVITIPMPSFESATTMVVVGAGSRYETKANNGLSHFLEHMVFKGTKKRPTALEISTLIDGVGGEFNAFTGKEITGFYIKSSTAHLELSFDVISDILQNSIFDKAEIDKERGVILEEINLYEDTPSRRISEIYEKLLYGDTPMGWDVAGEKEIIRKIQREDFTAYLNQLYSAGNILVVVAGGIEEGKVNGLSEKYFGQMKDFDTLRYKKVVENQGEPQLHIKKKTTEQVHIALGVRTAAVSSEYRYPLSILSAILGGGMSSRLFHEIREKRGLAYYVRTIPEYYQDCGTLVTTAGVDPKRVDEAVKVILNEYNKMKNSEFRIQNSELKKAKEFLKGHLVLELEDSRSVAGFYAEQEMLEKSIDNPDGVLAKIEKVSVSEIVEAAKKFFVNQSLNLAMIGNFEDGEKFREILKLEVGR